MSEHNNMWIVEMPTSRLPVADEVLEDRKEVAFERFEGDMSAKGIQVTTVPPGSDLNMYGWSEAGEEIIVFARLATNTALLIEAAPEDIELIRRLGYRARRKNEGDAV